MRIFTIKSHKKEDNMEPSHTLDSIYYKTYGNLEKGLELNFTGILETDP